MDNTEDLKLFISYSHTDEKEIVRFIKHIAPLKTNGLIENWYDRKIIPGQEFQDKIDNNLQDADIICLFISADFLSSNACMKEKENALKYKRTKGIAVIPIILSTCGWLDDKDLSSLLALPIDGQPISDFTDSNKAWNIVYNGLKDVVKKELK